jgi:hypothetical protein
MCLSIKIERRFTQHWKKICREAQLGGRQNRTHQTIPSLLFNTNVPAYTK